MRKKLFGYLFTSLFFIILLEIVFRAYFSIYFQTPFFQPSAIINHYYPELEKLDHVYDSENIFNILILGGSVITYGFSDIELLLQEQLDSLTPQHVRIYNLAKPAHASLDSYHKINLKDIQGFDLVLVYHGINELRANNCPPDFFKANYEHFSWYKEIALITENTTKDYCTTWFGFQWIGVQLSKKITGNLPTHFPKETWMDYGSEIKTAAPFENNLRQIISKSHEANIPVLLSTFAYHRAKNYSKQAFLDKSLDYGSHLCLTESWGDEPHVVKGLETHNSIIKKLTAEYEEGVHFFDMEKHLTKSADNFNDICHITRAASEEFVELILPTVDSIILLKK